MTSSYIFDSAEQSGFGAVLFDLKETEDGLMRPQLGAGWASLKGQKAFRFQSYEELDSSVLWICNLDRQTFWKSGAIKIKRLKESVFFKTDMGALIREIGVNPKIVGPTVTVEKISFIYNKTFSLLKQHYKCHDFSEADLCDILKKMLIPDDVPLGLELDEALSRGFADFISCPQKILNNSNVMRVTLHRPRFTHAKQICESLIPSGEWTFFSDTDLPEKEIRLNWLIEQKRPVLALVQLKGFLEKCPSYMLPLLQTGDAIGTAGRKKERNWMTLQELRYFSRFMRIDIQCVFMSEHFDNFITAKELLNAGPLSDLSISIGLLAECHWLALSSRSRHPETKSKSMVSPRACWLRSADRFFCFTAAIPLAAAGFKVISYGNGSVTVAVEKEKISDLAQSAAGCGLLPPLSVFSYK